MAVSDFNDFDELRAPIDADPERAERVRRKVDELRAQQDRKPTPFYDLPADHFPFTIEYVVDGVVTHSDTVHEAGSLRVPPMSELSPLGLPVSVHMIWPDGTDTWSHPGDDEL